MSHLCFAAFALALLLAQASAIEVSPSEKTCAAVFKGEVVSETIVQALTNRSPSAEVYAARIKVTALTKQDTKLENEVTVYYIYDGWQVCPRCVDLTIGQKATFYCYRGTIGGKTNALFLPMATFVVSEK